MSFSALQRAEIAEMMHDASTQMHYVCFSALQRAEIAEIGERGSAAGAAPGFSALQRAEIAEIQLPTALISYSRVFQCSSTSRNC